MKAIQSAPWHGCSEFPPCRFLDVGDPLTKFIKVHFIKVHFSQVQTGIAFKAIRSLFGLFGAQRLENAIGIITPYNEQIAELRYALDNDLRRWVDQGGKWEKYIEQASHKTLLGDI